MLDSDKMISSVSDLKSNTVDMTKHLGDQQSSCPVDSWTVILFSLLSHETTLIVLSFSLKADEASASLLRDTRVNASTDALGKTAGNTVGL